MAAGYIRGPTGLWETAQGVPITLRLVVDQSDQWGTCAHAQFGGTARTRWLFASPPRTNQRRKRTGEYSGLGQCRYGRHAVHHVALHQSGRGLVYAALGSPRDRWIGQNWSNYNSAAFNALDHRSLGNNSTPTKRTPSTPRPTQCFGPTWLGCRSSTNQPSRRGAGIGQCLTCTERSQSPLVCLRLGRESTRIDRQYDASVAPLVERWPTKRRIGDAITSLGTSDLNIARCTHSSEWRNRQTRQLEGLVPARAWGFKSPLRHDQTDFLLAVFLKRTGRQAFR